jgi:uncharacterized protein
MTLSLDENSAAYQIRAYKPGFLQVNEITYTASLIISSEKIIPNWRPQTLTQLTAADFDEILNLRPTILLIGTGSTLVFPSVELYGHLINQGIGVEIMNTSAACRTYNALAAEGRNVMAALLIQ